MVAEWHDRPRPEILQPDDAIFGTLDAIGGWRCKQYDGIVAWAACERFGRG
jgi:hypothetical protein